MPGVAVEGGETSAKHAREALGMLLRLGWMERTGGPDADCED